MENPTLVKAVLFCDLVGSTALYEKWGDVAAQKMIGEVFDLLGEIVSQNWGKVVKTIGDEMMVVFETSERAIQCALEVGTSLDGVENFESGGLMGFRIGISFGPVVEENGDYFGQTVNLAARLVALAKPHQILTTQELSDHLGGLARVRFVDHVRLKGIHALQDLFEILPLNGNEECTFAFEEPAKAATESATLTLVCQGKDFMVSAEKHQVSMGRDATNDIMMDEKGVSRIHARVELKNGRFYLVDNSLNGTHLLTADGVKHFVKRDEYVLVGAGEIFIGQPNEPPAVTIHFKVN
ncbi:MAG: adenylate/guanylate cyclase [uncultured bacterium]|nr:MAG: adenylate/guanylate cyclase [uncultured bacterium]